MTRRKYIKKAQNHQWEHDSIGWLTSSDHELCRTLINKLRFVYLICFFVVVVSFRFFFSSAWLWYCWLIIYMFFGVVGERIGILMCVTEMYDFEWVHRMHRSYRVHIWSLIISSIHNMHRIDGMVAVWVFLLNSIYTYREPTYTMWNNILNYIYDDCKVVHYIVQ